MKRSRRCALLPALAVFSFADTASSQWTQTTLPEQRYRMTGVGLPGFAVFGGGHDANAAAADEVFVFDEVAGTFTTTYLSGRRYYMAGAALGDRIYFGGGCLGCQPGHVQSLTDAVDVYDNSTGTWTTDSLSLARHSLGAGAVGTKVLFGGGIVTSLGFSDLVDIFDEATGTWTTASLSVPRGRLAAATVGTRILFAGGDDGFVSSRVDIYDDASGAWTTAELSVPRNYLAAATVGDLVLFAGGGAATPTLTTDAVDIYDSVNNTWSTASLSQARRLVVAATAGDRVVFAGGQHDLTMIGSSDVVDIYDSRTNTWSVATLTGPREQIGAASTGDQAVFAGGLALAGGGGVLDIVEIYDPNPGVPYCSPALPNSTGVSATIRATGSRTATDNDIVLVAEGMPPGEFGYFITSRTQGTAIPFGSNGRICVSGNIGRFNRPAQVFVGPSSTLVLDLGSLPVNPPTAANAGEVWNFQAWFQDVPATSNFTNGVSVVLL